jgi:hypothetical protein
MGIKYQIKRAIIKRAMAKRKKGYTFNEADGDDFNNSYYFTAHNRDGESLFFRLGYRGDGEKEVWAVFVDKAGKEYIAKTTNATAHKFGFSYTETGFEMTGEFTPTEREYEFTRDSDPTVFANLLAGLKWTKGFDADFKKIQQTHIEQAGEITAKIKLGGKQIDFTGMAARDHSWGRRVWSDMHSHKWFLAIFEGGVLCVSTVNGLIAGYFCKDGVVHNVVDAIFDDGQYSVKLDNEWFLIVTYKTKHSIPFSFQDGAYKIDEGIASFEITSPTLMGMRRKKSPKIDINEPFSAWGITEFGHNTREVKE